MQTNILWAGSEYHSLENCLITSTHAGNDINSIIIGHYENKICSAAYHIKTGIHWETYFLKLNYRIDNKETELRLEKDINENWWLNEKQMDAFKSCVDIDISITPFTNTLSINRLKLSPNEEREIQVIYIDVFEEQVKQVHQKYQKLSDMTYLYKNVPGDFEAEIEVDESGFVVNYSSLFERKALLKTSR